MVHARQAGADRAQIESAPALLVHARSRGRRALFGGDVQVVVARTDVTDRPDARVRRRRRQGHQACRRGEDARRDLRRCQPAQDLRVVRDQSAGTARRATRTAGARVRIASTHAAHREPQLGEGGGVQVGGGEGQHAKVRGVAQRAEGLAQGAARAAGGGEGRERRLARPRGGNRHIPRI